MKIVIAGAGSVGMYLIQMLNQAEHDIIVIDHDKEKLITISSHFDILTVNGNSTSIEILKEAKVDECDLFIGLAEMQESNIISCILSKKLGAKKTVARIDNIEYLRKENKEYLFNLGINSLIYPEILASEEILDVIKQPGLNKTVIFASGKLALFIIKVEKDSHHIGKTLIQIAEEYPNLEYRTVAISRGNETIIPWGADILQVNDLLYIITFPESQKKLLEFSGSKNFMAKNIIILGGSRIGFKTAKFLENDYYVKLIEKDKEKSLNLAELLEKTLVINSEGLSAEFMLEEGIQKTEVFIAVTGNSEINILSCLLAKKLGVLKTIAEVENNDYIQLARNMNIDIIINKKLIAASHIYSYTLDAEVENIQCLTITDAEVMEFVAHRNSKITKKTIKDLNFPKNAIIGGVLRGNECFIAKGDTQILEEDRVVVFTLHDGIDKVANFFT